MSQPLSNLEDEYKWALETAAAVRAGNWDAIDRESLVSELERSIAGGFKRQLYQYVRDLMRARLSLKLAPDTDTKDNETLGRQSLTRMKSLLWACPSLETAITEDFVAHAYEGVKYIIGDEIQLPIRCPYPAEQILKEGLAGDVEEL